MIHYSLLSRLIFLEGIGSRVSKIFGFLVAAAPLYIRNSDAAVEIFLDE